MARIRIVRLLVALLLVIAAPPKSPRQRGGSRGCPARTSGSGAVGSARSVRQRRRHRCND